LHGSGVGGHSVILADPQQRFVVSLVLTVSILGSEREGREQQERGAVRDVHRAAKGGTIVEPAPQSITKD
jgi:uncharacterized protein (DUF2236 family)